MQTKKHSSFIILTFFLLALTFCFSGCWKSKDMSALYDDESAYTGTPHFASVASVSIVTSNKIDLSFGKLSGIKQVKTINIKEDTSFNIDVQLTEGRIKIILVSGNDWYALCEGSTQKEDFKPDIPAGKYKLRIVADKAAAKILINIKE